MTVYQHDQVMQMLDGNICTAHVMANMAGMTHDIPLSKITVFRWIIDSGATNHMISSLDVLHDVPHLLRIHKIGKYIYRMEEILW